MQLAAILDCYGEDYPGLFLDEQGDIQADVAVRLGEVAARIVSGQLSMWQLSEIFEEVPLRRRPKTRTRATTRQFLTLLNTPILQPYKPIEWNSKYSCNFGPHILVKHW
jgi:hypothetical protein